MFRGRRSRQLFAHELRGLLVLAGPLVVNQLGQVGMHTADTIMVGPLGAEPLAAVGLGSALHHFGVLIMTGALMGMAPLVSQAFGAGDIAECRRVFVQGCWVALLLSAPVMLGLLFGEDLSLLLGQEQGVSVITGAYLQALFWGIMPALVFIAARQYLEGMGHVTAPMVVTFIGLGINIVANFILIYGVDGLVPAFGAVGAGWATTIVRWSMLLALLVFLLTHRALPSLRVSLRPRAAEVRRIIAVGLPVGVQFGMEVGLFSFAAIMMGWLGAVELAAHQVTINIAATTFMVALGASIAGSIRVGQHIGGRRTRAARRAVVATYLLALGFMLACALLFVSAPRFLIGLYTPHAEIIELGGTLLLVAAAFQIFDGAQVAGVSVLRGAGDTRGPMVLAAIGYWAIGLTSCWYLGFRTPLGAVGIWIGLCIGLAAVALMLVLRARAVLWRRPLRRLAEAGPIPVMEESR
ncbi:MAG TPA: MATE family efflux transporter [Longimicrobiales bacterium]|nr:MATE family efflux transporter [Longimicrobiales bacterium]